MSLWAAYTFQYLIIVHRLIIFLSLLAEPAAAGMLITRDFYAEITERGKQEASKCLSFFLSFLLSFTVACVVGTVSRWQADASCRESPEGKKKKKEKRNTRQPYEGNTGNNGTIVTSRPVNSAYDLIIPSMDCNRNNRDSQLRTSNVRLHPVVERNGRENFHCKSLRYVIREKYFPCNMYNMSYLILKCNMSVGHLKFSRDY